MKKIETIKWYDSLISTNTTAKNFAAAGKIDSGTIIAARLQTGGRGRAGRTWLSDKDTNLTFSLFWTTKSENYISLPLVIAVAVANSLKALSLNPCLKWPNDILVNGRKICGILCETLSETPQDLPVIIGIGLNVNMPPKQAERIDQPCTSIYMETGQKYSPEAILENIAGQLEIILDDFNRLGFAAIKDRWLEMSIPVGTAVDVRENDSTQWQGAFKGIDDIGRVLLETDSGQIKTFLSANISLRHS